MIPLGVALFFVGHRPARARRPPSPGPPAALAFSAGTFLCIALSDLLPELQFHAHDRFKLSVALLAGFRPDGRDGRSAEPGDGGSPAAASRGNVRTAVSRRSSPISLTDRQNGIPDAGRMVPWRYDGTAAFVARRMRCARIGNRRIRLATFLRIADACDGHACRTA